MVAAEGGERLLLLRGKILSVEQDRALRRLVQRGKDVQKRRLARAGFAHDGNVFALLHGEIHIVQRLNAAAPETGGINLLYVLYFQ